MNRRDGFTLIETLVASAVAAMAIAAAASSVAAAHRLDGAARFYREASRAANELHARRVGAVEPGDDLSDGLPPMIQEEQVYAPVPDRHAPGWISYRIQDPATGRQVGMALADSW